MVEISRGHPHPIFHSVMDSYCSHPKPDLKDFPPSSVWANVYLSKQGGCRSERVVNAVEERLKELETLQIKFTELVKQIQIACDITVDGILGPSTLEAITTIKDLKLDAERFRHLLEFMIIVTEIDENERRMGLELNWDSVVPIRFVNDIRELIDRQRLTEVESDCV
jgi:hypothetical protein